jgi:hypothetical protein
MSTEAQAAAEGPLSVEQAVGLLEAAPDPVEPLEETPAQESEAEPTAEEAPDPEEAIEGEEEAEPESDPETPAIAAPTSWDATERALFATLPPEAQQVIAGREAERDKAVSKAQTEATQAKQAATQEVQQIAQLKGHLEQILPKAQQVFQDKWANVDWVAWAQQDPQAAFIGREQFAAEQAEMGRLQAASQHAQRVAQQAFIAEEGEKLKTLAPELADPVKGPERRQAVAQYLIKAGADPQGLETLPAAAVAVAYKAYLYDQLQAGAKPTPKTPQPARPAVKPTAAAPARTPQRQAEQITNRFRQTGSVEDAVAMLDARSVRKAS